MSKVKRTKLNQLLKNWPRGAVGTAAWLTRSGYSSDLLAKYETSDWLRSLGYGAYVRSDDRSTWQGAVWALEEQLKLPVHVGGKTALLLHGAAHFLPRAKPTLHLYRPLGTTVPKWFLQSDWELTVELHPSSLLSSTVGLGKFESGGFSLLVSSREQALMEVLDDVTADGGFEEAANLMDYQGTARPELVQKLLEKCNSIKVKRLFLLLAERSGHAWLTRLKPGRFDLGTGKRQLVSNGTFNKKYKITVPREVRAPEV